MSNFTRRQFCKYLGASTVGPLAGGCSQSPKALTCEGPAVNSSAFLAIPPYAQSDFFPCIDVHGHFFNATDMQAGGYLSGPVASSFGLKEKFRRAAETFGRLLDRTASRIVPSASEELEYIAKLEEEFSIRQFEIQSFDQQEALKNNIERRIKDDADRRKEIITEEFFEFLSNEDFSNEYNTLVENELSGPDRFRFSLDKQFIRQALDDEYHTTQNEAQFMNFKFWEIGLWVTSLIAFSGRMCSYRVDNIQKYRSQYYEKPRDVKIISAANAMVDFDRWVGKDEPHSSLKEQIKLNSKLAQIHGGYIFNLVSFNPWHVIEFGNSYLDIIECSLQDDTFKGVKIYPPIGYFPWNNETRKIERPAPYPEGKLKELDQALGNLYEICGNKYPVMAHGANSMGTRINYNVMAGPKGWQDALTKYPDLKVLIGHFGAEGNGWTSTYVDMMKKIGGLYADLGYWEELQNNDRQFEELYRLLEVDIGGNKKASSRVMFGTGWFMTIMESGWKSYLEEFYYRFKSKNNDEVLNNVFFNNAKIFFDLQL